MEKEKRVAINWQRIIILWVIGAAAMIALVVALLLFFLVPALQPIIERGDAFLTAIQESDLDAAYAMLSPELQGEINREVFDDNLARYFGIQSWSYSQRVNRNRLGRLEGHLIDASGEKIDFRLLLEPDGDDWDISHYEIFETP